MGESASRNRLRSRNESADRNQPKSRKESVDRIWPKSVGEQKRIVGLLKNRIGGRLTEFSVKAEFELNQIGVPTHIYIYICLVIYMYEMT